MIGRHYQGRCLFLAELMRRINSAHTSELVVGSHSKPPQVLALQCIELGDLAVDFLCGKHSMCPPKVSSDCVALNSEADFLRLRGGGGGVLLR